MSIDPGVIAAVVLGGATLGAAGIAAWASLASNRRTKTNHGMTIGQHVEQAGVDAKAAREAAELVAIQLSQYKAEQALIQLHTAEAMTTHTSQDSENFQEMRRLIAMILSMINPDAR